MKKLVLDLFSTIRKALFDRKQREVAQPYVHEPSRFRNEHPHYNSKSLWKNRSVRWFSGATMRGSAFLPKDGDWSAASRQVRRAALRAINFTKVSRQFLLMPRRDRRRLSRVLACEQYRTAQKGMQPA